MLLLPLTGRVLPLSLTFIAAKTVFVFIFTASFYYPLNHNRWDSYKLKT